MIGILILMLILFLVKWRVTLPSWLTLYTSLLPSWRFFENLGSTPRLMMRFGPREDALGSWLPCFQKMPRRWSSLFLNPEGNFRHACDSLVDRLVQELELHDERTGSIQESVSYQLTQRLVRSRLITAYAAKQGTTFQFQITVTSSDLESNDNYDALTSSVHEV